MHKGRSQCLMETQLNAHRPLTMLNGDSTQCTLAAPNALWRLNSMYTGRSQCLMETQLNVHWPLPMLNGDSTQCTQAAPNA